MAARRAARWEICHEYPPKSAAVRSSGRELTLEHLDNCLHFGFMNLLDRITIEPGKCGGRPCIRGYRIRVSDILELLAAAASREEILADYEFLESEDITAALTYAAQQTDHSILAA